MTFGQITALLQSFFGEGVVVSQTTLLRGKDGAPIVGGSVVFGELGRYWNTACEPEDISEAHIRDLAQHLCTHHGFPARKPNLAGQKE